MVGCSVSTLSGSWTPNSTMTALITLAASSELPPTPKKFSPIPTAKPRTSCHCRASQISAGSLGRW